MHLAMPTGARRYPGNPGCVLCRSLRGAAHRWCLAGHSMEVICSDIQWHQLDQHKHYNIYRYVCDICFFKNTGSIYVYARHMYIYIFNVYLVSQLYRYIYISYKLALVLQIRAISTSIQLTKHISIYAGFLKWRYPQIIQIKPSMTTLVLKPMVTWGCPMSRTPHVHVYILYVYIYMYICICICLYDFICLYVYISTLLCIYTCVYTYVYIRVYINSTNHSWLI